MSQTNKVIVGVDYGTTYSGICFVHSSAASYRDIKPFTAWPGAHQLNNEHLEKVPSQYAYASENSILDGDVWGYQVSSDLVSCAWTKLLLDKNALKTQFDDPELVEYDSPSHLDSVSNGLMRLPPGKAAGQVVRDYLHGLHTTLMEAIESRITHDILKLTPIEFWITVPAIWSDQAKDATLRAARAAGFGSRAGDGIFLTQEPEAAAHYTLRCAMETSPELIKENTGIMVCDCGGGTVDVTTYTITRVSPALELAESCVGIGGKCGGTYVDRNLHALLFRRFGSAFSTLKPEKIGPGSRFMKEFESAKRTFGSTGDPRRPTRLRLVIPAFSKLTEDIYGYDIEYGEIILTYADMEECFKPITDKIRKLVSQQEMEVAKAKAPKVKTLALVGGLGDSPYVQNVLREWCGSSIRLIQPWSGSWSAVVRGAALRGLEGSYVKKHLCRRHYGHNLSTWESSNLHSTTDERWQRRYVCPFEKKTVIPDYMQWVVGKGDTISNDTQTSHEYCMTIRGNSERVFTEHIYACSLDEAPDSPYHQQVEQIGEVVTDLSDFDLKDCKSATENGEQIWQALLKIELSLGEEKGAMVFRTLFKGKEVGHTSIKFSGASDDPLTSLARKTQTLKLSS